jgi:hypothetical protein
LCRTLLESGALLIENGEAFLAGGIDKLQIPDTVQAVLKSRLDRLDPEAREVLRCAAVIGRQFGLELLSRVVPSRPRVQGALDTLRSAGLIQRTGLVPEPTYRFKHALTLDVTYESLLERQKKERHAVVGSAIEDLHAERLEEQSAQLALHFAMAEDWDKAIHYGLLAAKRAAGLWRLPETVEMLVRTRGWIERSGKDSAERNSLLVPLLLELESGEVTPLADLDAGGLPLGIIPGAEYSVQTSQIPAGSRLALYTDGIAEAFNAENAEHIEFGQEGLCRSLSDSAHDSLEETVQNLFDASREFTGGHGRHDDTSVVIVERSAEFLPLIPANTDAAAVAE